MFRRHVVKQLSSYLDNQLSERQKRKVEDHLTQCKVCSREFEQLKSLSQRIKTWQANGPDASFDSSVRNKIVTWELERGRVKMNKKTLAIFIPSGVIVSILVVVFLGQLYLKRGLQGRFRDARDYSLGETYSSVPQLNKERRLAEELKNLRPVNGLTVKAYEPYYAVGAEKVKDANYASSIPATVPLPNQPGEGSVIVIQPILPVTGEGEKVIRSGSIQLEVENGKETYQKVSLICQELEGFLATSNFYKDRDGREAGTITMRIPKDKFNAALDRLGALGKVENINTNSQDVSQEYANLKSQLDAAMIVYNKMLEALQKRQTTIPEAMRLESELTPVLKRVEDLKNKIEYLNNLVAYTTITVSFHESEVSIKTFKESINFIRASLLTSASNAVKFLSRAIPVIIVLGVLIALAIPLIIAVKNWITRIFKQ